MTTTTAMESTTTTMKSMDTPTVTVGGPAAIPTDRRWAEEA
jgi:hypothetical protein